MLCCIFGLMIIFNILLVDVETTNFRSIIIVGLLKTSCAWANVTSHTLFIMFFGSTSCAPVCSVSHEHGIYLVLDTFF
jgi:hypothetical protein